MHKNFVRTLFRLAYVSPQGLEAQDRRLVEQVPYYIDSREHEKDTWEIIMKGSYYW